ncbi:unnamed protein product [Ascophyllum nodosum]
MEMPMLSPSEGPHKCHCRRTAVVAAAPAMISRTIHRKLRSGFNLNVPQSSLSPW